MVKIFIIDDHPFFIDGIKAQIHSKADKIDVVGSASSINEAIHSPECEEIDIFILDLYLSDSYPPNNVRALKTKFRNKKIIILTSETSCIWVGALLKEGADAYLTKDISSSEFKSTIKRVLNGEKIFPAEKIIRQPKTNSLYFSPVQTNLIKLLCKGLSVKQIADIMCINPFKVNYLLKKIRKTYDVKNNVELIAIFLKKSYNLTQISE